MSYSIDDPRIACRFWEKVTPEPNTGCWLWSAALDGSGYGRLTLNRVSRSAHRLAYETLVGTVQNGLELDHLCRTRSCCNPAHLEPVTRQQNCKRGLRGALHTNCPHGHEFTPSNTAININGHRFCRTCSRTRGTAYNHRMSPWNGNGRPALTVCKRGHILAITARVKSSGLRKCLECANQLQRERRAAARDRDLLGA